MDKDKISDKLQEFESAFSDNQIIRNVSAAIKELDSSIHNYFNEDDISKEVLESIEVVIDKMKNLTLQDRHSGDDEKTRITPEGGFGETNIV